MAFLLATVARLLGAVLSLLWTRWLLAAMSPALYGIFITYQALFLFGAMGDLGLGGSVGIEATRLIGARRINDLRQYLAPARTAFVILAFTLAGLFALASPWLAPLLGLTRTVHGSLFLLFAVGGFMLGVTVLANFTTALSNACRNLTWPIIPNLVGAQLAMALHVFIARARGPLWLQLVPYAGAAVLAMLLPWVFTRISDPTLSELQFGRLSWRNARRLFSQSLWVYLWSFGFVVYMTTDRLVINRFFGPEVAANYYVNYKPAELAVFLLITLTFVTVTKVVQWHCSPEGRDRITAAEAALKLQRISAFLGIAAGLIYLALNDLFVRLWLGPDHTVPLVLQGLFAANLAVTVSGDPGTRVAGQISAYGTKFAGVMVVFTALINLVLSILSARMGVISGVAAATLAAQAFFGATTGYFVARELSVSPNQWIFRSTILPLLMLGAGYLLRAHVATYTALTAGVGTAVLGAFLLANALFLGVDRKLLKEEWSIVTSMMKREVANAT